MMTRWLLTGLVLLAVLGVAACRDAEHVASTPSPAAPEDGRVVPAASGGLARERDVDSEGDSKRFRWRAPADPGVEGVLQIPDGFVLGGEASAGPDAEGATYVWPGEPRSLASAPASQGNVGFVIPNDVPTAHAGSDIEVLAGDPAQASGGNSFDLNGDELTYRWRITARPPGSLASLSGEGTVDPVLRTDLPGRYELSLTVNDGSDDSVADVVAVTARPWFTGVTGAAGVFGGWKVRRGDEFYEGGYGSGAAWGDYDNDNDPDLYLTRDGRNMLYRNNGDGTFTNVAAEAGVGSHLESLGAAWGDFDNDGDLDLYVVSRGEQETNILYRNNGDGTFTDVSAEAGVAYAGHGVGAVWADIFDGRLSLFVSNRRGPEHPERAGKPSALFRSRPDGTFTEVRLDGFPGRSSRSAEGGSTRPIDSSFSLGAVWFDYDGDGDSDLFVVAESGVSRLYRNDGIGTLVYVTEQPGLLGYQMSLDAATGIHVLESNGRLTDVTERVGLAVPGRARGAISADYDNDGDVDLFVSGYDASRLWRNNGDGTFTDVAASAGLTHPPAGWGAAGFLDFDNDGNLDLFVANGARGENGSGGQPNRLYRSNGDGTFSDVTSLAGVGHRGDSRAVAFADFDRDGDIDIYVVNADGENFLYRNEIGTRMNWVRVLLLGITSNSMGIGAEVRVTTRDGVTRTASLSGGSWYLGQNDSELLFGIGFSDHADLRIIWPSGSLQDHWGAWSNDLVRIQERTRGGW